MAPKAITRRDFVKESGGLVIGFSLVNSTVLPRLLAADAPTSVATPSPARLDSWLQAHERRHHPRLHRQARNRHGR